MSKMICLPVIKGPTVRAVYKDGQLLMSGSAGEVLPGSLGESSLAGKVTYEVVLAAMKTGGVLPVFTGIQTVSRKFATLISVLEHLAALDCSPVLPYPFPVGDNRRPVEDWCRALPFHVLGYKLVADRGDAPPLFFPLSISSKAVRVLDVAWRSRDGGLLVPHLLLGEAVKFKGAITDEVSLLSLAAGAALGAGRGATVVSYGSWIEKATDGQAFRYPSRCPKCMAPTLKSGIHLKCSKCGESDGK